MVSPKDRNLRTTVHSLVIPVFNEEDGLDTLHARLKDLAAKLEPESVEIVLVNDGSTDRSEEILDSIAASNPEIKIVHLSRNFGHQMAITAGLNAASGDTVTVLDADLQDPPELIIELIKKWREGFDVVYAVRRSRPGETWAKLVTAKIFYRLMHGLTSIDIPLDTGDFRLMDRAVVEALKLMEEQHRFVRGMVSWVGFRQTKVLYDRCERTFGATHFSTRKMVHFAVDGITSFSTVPLRLATLLGFGSAAFAILVSLWALYVKFFTNTAVQGWLSVICAVSFLGGTQLITLGILGEYLGRTYNEVKRRPLYIVKRTMGFDGQAFR